MPNHLRVPLFGALLILPLLMSGCYPFQGDIATILTPAAPPAVEETADPPEPEMVILEATVTVNALRVRQEPNAETSIIAGLLKDDVIPVVARTEDGSWLKVEVPDIGTVGWIWAEDVSLDGAASALAVSEGEQTVDATEDAMAAEEETDGEAAETADEETIEEGASAFADLEPSLTIHSQDVIRGHVTIAEAVVPVEGWVVIHADDAGSFGPIIGQAHLEAGTTIDLTVDVDVNTATETLYAMLHTDGGVFDVFEFPGTDMPILEDGEPISLPFTVIIGEMSASEETGDQEEVPETTPIDEPLLTLGEVTQHLAIVTTRALRVRSKPETIAEVLAGVAVGEAYPVAGFSSDEHWVAIFFPNIEEPVWIAASLVELQEIASLSVQIGRATIETGQGGRLRLRGGPSVEDPIVGFVPDGETYNTLGYSEDGEWALLVGTGTEGASWASVAFLLFE